MKKSKKSKESNKEVFTVYLHYDGLFITSPLTYAEGSRREINDINFDVIKDFSTHDGFLNKLCTTRAVFRGSTSRQQVDDIPEEDPQNEEIDVVFKIKKGVNYPTFDPTIPWDKMEPVLGMKYESHTVKNKLLTYGVAMVIRCRCAGMKGNKNRKMTVIDSGEGSSNQVNRSKVKKVKKVKKSNKGVQVKNMILRSSVNAQNPSGEGTIQLASGVIPKKDKKEIS
ncbi:hypothetical protein Tco_1120389 [Tanacetum coccineum]